MDRNEKRGKVLGFNLLKHINGEDKEIVIWLFNIGVEKYWNEKKVYVKDLKEDVIVNHIEEINCLITKKQDILILRNIPDQNYLEELDKKGFEIPHIICPCIEDETLSISELVLKDDTLGIRLITMIQEIKHSNNCRYHNSEVVFVPYGVSNLEEEISNKYGIQLFGSSSDISKIINDKVYARNLAIDKGFKVSQGVVCTNLEEVASNSYQYLKKYNKIIIKEPCGASGKGLWVVEDEKKLASVLLVLKRALRKYDNYEILVEEWCDKCADINYQIYIGVDGKIEVFSIKQQLLEETVYKGSLMSPKLSPKIIAQCNVAGEIIGAALSELGYIGIVGVDAILLEGDVLIPIIEINARFTLSTYLSFLGKGNRIAFYKRVALNQSRDYITFKRCLDALDIDAFIYVSETVNGRRLDGYGRLFCMINSQSDEQLMSDYKKVYQLLDHR